MTNYEAELERLRIKQAAVWQVARAKLLADAVKFYDEERKAGVYASHAYRKVCKEFPQLDQTELLRAVSR